MKVTLNTLITALTGAFSLNPVGGTGLDGQGAYNGYFGAGALVDPNDIEDDEPPKAFLNYILFDENFVLVDFGFDQVSTNAEQVGALPNVAHDYLSLHLQVKQKGYLYVYLSNETPVMANVYFDDFKLTYYTGIEQSNDYYSFGLNFNSFSKEQSLANKYLYNGKEMNKYIFLLVFFLIACNTNKKKDAITLSNDSLQLILTQWKADSLGCERLRDPKKIRQLIDQIELVGKDSSVVINYLGSPNERNHIGTDTTVFFYYMACGMNHGIGFNFYCSFAKDKMFAVHTLILN